MYNPSRGGVRGGADQFTWESVKNDKHRENYLGHSLKAPVGRWQKGKDLSWYAKERKDGDAPDISEKLELASIKKAEEEAMLIALGHNIVRKETHKLSKEEIREALKRNTGEKDDRNIERVDGVGASSKRAALLSNTGSISKHKNEGVAFENNKEKATSAVDTSERKYDSSEERKKGKKKSKKHKKEKKHKKHRKYSTESDSEESVSKYKTKPKKCDSESNRKSSNIKSHKTSKHKHKDYSSDNEEGKYRSKSQYESRKRYEKQSDFISVKKRRHESSDTD